MSNHTKYSPKGAAKGSITYSAYYSAYLVGFFCMKTGNFLGFGIFSEPGPTTYSAQYTFVLLEIERDSYQEAYDAMTMLIESSPHYKWTHRWLDQHYRAEPAAPPPKDETQTEGMECRPDAPWNF